MLQARSSYLQRERRVAVELDALVVEPDGCRVRVELLDVSSSGFRLRTNAEFVLDEDVVLHMPRSAPLRARICWTRGSEAGGIFLDAAEQID